MEIMPQRDKRIDSLVLKGNYVILQEIKPEFFECVIKWRNDPGLNKYINQSYKLTMEKEYDWYNFIYLNDNTQGYMIMLDKENNCPFGTVGWTDYDSSKRRLVQGRIMRALPEYRKSRAYEESYKLLGAYLYKYIDVMYAHVVKENVASIKLHERLGFGRNENRIVYPHELEKGNLKQYEFFRTKSDFYAVKSV